MGEWETGSCEVSPHALRLIFLPAEPAFSAKFAQFDSINSSLGADEIPDASFGREDFKWDRLPACQFRLKTRQAGSLSHEKFTTLRHRRVGQGRNRVQGVIPCGSFWGP